MKRALQTISESFEIVMCMALKIAEYLLDPDTNEPLEL